MSTHDHHYAGGKSLVAEVLMLARLHKVQLALKQAQPRQRQQQQRGPVQQPVTRALMVLPYLSIGVCWCLCVGRQRMARVSMQPPLRRKHAYAQPSCLPLSPLPAVSEKAAHLTKLLECVKWRVRGYKGDGADGQPLGHPVS
jgi:hypothetical protein